MDMYFRSAKKVRGALLGYENVVGVGIGHKEVGEEDTGKPAFIVYVEQKLPAANLARGQVVPRQIDGLVTDVVEIGVVRMLGGRTSRERPCQPGMSIGHYRTTAGTLGAVVKDRATGQPMILSNNHVLANGSSIQEARARIGDPVLQPGPYDGGTIRDRVATLYRYVPLVKSVGKPDCQVASAVARGGSRLLQMFRRDYELRFYKHYKEDNTVDCALANIDGPDLIDPSIMEVGDITGTTTAVPGRKVLKSGRTTGLTRGKIKSVNTTLQVEMKEDEKIWFSDQVVTDILSQPGDSGSLVLDEERRVVGLLFAGSERLAIFNNIENVTNKLGIELIYTKK